MSRTTHRPVALVLAAVLGATVVTASPRAARADNPSPGSNEGKGAAGGALLGAEVPLIIEGIAGVHSGWVYLISAVLCAGGGGVGGYELGVNSTDGKAPMYLLAGGLALVIPAVVLPLNATRYQPEEGATEDRSPGPQAEPGAPGGNSITGVPGGASPAAAPPATPAPSPAPAPAPGGGTATPPQSLIDLHGGALRLGVPAPSVGPSVSVAEAKRFGIKDTGTQVQLPVLRVAF